MTAPGLVSLRLDAFKSLAGQEIRFEPITLLIGRNGSGKSNALDALSLLALLADGRDVNDLDRGDDEVAGLRGGLSGAAPYGSSNVRVGCTVRSENGDELDLDLVIDAAVSGESSVERPEIISEQLVLRSGGGKKKVLLDARRQSSGSGIADVQVYSGGAPRTFHLLANRLAVAQAATKIPDDTKARQLVARCCAEIVSVLRGVFVLDPVPGLMREYVRIGSPPDRSGSSVSALVYELRRHPDAWDRLVSLIQDLVESDVEEVSFAEGRLLPNDRLVDVMVALVERIGRSSFTVPARLMSDGTLRYLAIVASLLYQRSADGDVGRAAHRTLVIEEIENGLFPSQAARVLALLRDEAHEQGVPLVASTHSPALLDALLPGDHAGVIICDRRGDGTSELRRLVDHPRYVEVASGGLVGRAVTMGLLAEPPRGGGHSLSDLFAS